MTDVIYDGELLVGGGQGGGAHLPPLRACHVTVSRAAVAWSHPGSDRGLLGVLALDGARVHAASVPTGGGGGGDASDTLLFLVIVPNAQLRQSRPQLLLTPASLSELCVWLSALAETVAVLDPSASAVIEGDSPPLTRLSDVFAVGASQGALLLQQPLGSPSAAPGVSAPL